MSTIEAAHLSEKIITSGFEAEVSTKPGHQRVGQEVWVSSPSINPDLFEYLHGLYKQQDLLMWDIRPSGGWVAFVFQ